MVHDRLDAVKVRFDAERMVYNAAVLVVVRLSRRLGLGVLVGCVRALGQGTGRGLAGTQAHEPGLRAVLGAQSIGGCDVRRSGRTGRLLGHEPPRLAAPGLAASLNQRPRTGPGELFMCCMDNSTSHPAASEACRASGSEGRASGSRSRAILHKRGSVGPELRLGEWVCRHVGRVSGGRGRGCRRRRRSGRRRLAWRRTWRRRRRRVRGQTRRRAARRFRC